MSSVRSRVDESIVLNGSGSDAAAGLCEKKESADAAGESIASQVSGDD